MVEDTRPSDTNPAKTTLRRAAALIRERAEAVRTGAEEPDQWFGPEEIVDELMWGDQPQHGDVAADAAHIASWHPAVALAVAEWMESTANDVEYVHTPIYNLTSTTVARALAVARAYLGESA